MINIIAMLHLVIVLTSTEVSSMKSFSICLVILFLACQSFEASAFNLGNFANQVLGKKKKDKKKKDKKKNASPKSEEIQVEEKKLDAQQAATQDIEPQAGEVEKCIAKADAARGFKIECN